MTPSTCPRCGKPMATVWTADDPPIGVGAHECGGDQRCHDCGRLAVWDVDIKGGADWRHVDWPQDHVPVISADPPRTASDPLDRLTALLDAATPETWRATDTGAGFSITRRYATPDRGPGFEHEAVAIAHTAENAALIALAPTALRHAVALARAAETYVRLWDEPWRSADPAVRKQQADEMDAATVALKDKTAAFLSSIPEEGANG